MKNTTWLALALRILIALSTRTFFQPDEYFQSLEPAYHAVFGYGHLTWEWLNPYPIRSVIYPALNVPIYWALKFSGLHTGWLGDLLLIAGPRVLHGAFAAVTDVSVCNLTRRVLGQRYESTALFVSLTSFFHALSLSRSLSNSLETSLTTLAFSQYPWDTGTLLTIDRSSLRTTLYFAALACAVRPTNSVIWIYLFSSLLWRFRFKRQTLVAIVIDALAVGAATLSVIFILDSLYFRKATFTPLNFLMTNLSSVSLFYGANPWHYYITQALPILCTMALPFVLYGVWSTYFGHADQSHQRPLQSMLGVIIWSTGIYSAAGHKEWRFLHPLLPLFHVFATKSLVELSHPGVNSTSKFKSKPSQNSIYTNYHCYLPPIHRTYIKIMLLSVPASVYVVLFYCSAPVSVMGFLRSLPFNDLRDGGVGFLMPCHSTPGQSYLHRELAAGRMWSLGCEPPLQHQNLATYKDQTDVFYGSPLRYLEDRFPPVVNPLFPPSPFPSFVPGGMLISLDEAIEYPWKHEWPRFLVLFGALLDEEGVQPFLEEKGYVEVWKKGRKWEGEGRRLGGVRVWEWSGYSIVRRRSP